jgi:hypothetical protein
LSCAARRNLVRAVGSRFGEQYTEEQTKSGFDNAVDANELQGKKSTDNYASGFAGACLPGIVTIDYGLPTSPDAKHLRANSKRLRGALVYSEQKVFKIIDGWFYCPNETRRTVNTGISNSSVRLYAPPGDFVAPKTSAIS